MYIQLTNGKNMTKVFKVPRFWAYFSRSGFWELSARPARIARGVLP